MPGDPRVEAGKAGMTLVSIRARHQCRAIPAGQASAHVRGSFQSAPDINAGRSLTLWRSVRRSIVSIRARHQCRAIQPSVPSSRSTRLFQSAPDINAGRSCQPCGCQPCGCRFNPRPTSMPGDPFVPDWLDADQASFNPRPTSMPGDPWHACCALQKA